MKKNGFISISVVYSFFFIFLLLLLFIVNNMINDRILLSRIKEQVKEDISNTNFSRYLINHRDQNTLILHDYTIVDGARDNSYRFSGANPNNYVCFKAICNDNELYRIIGVIDGKVKLIKYTSLGTQAWNDTGFNNYAESKIDKYLNSDYLLSLGNISKLIDTIEWHTGGFSDTIKNGTITQSMLGKKTYEIYEYELGINMNNGIWIEKKIALPYISDYAFATIKSRFNYAISNNNNWLFSSNLWTISRNTNYVNQAFYIDNNGTLKSASVAEQKNIRPVFFLRGNVSYKGGDGSKTNPYKVGE